MKVYQHSAGEPFPFSQMEVGDVCISTAVNAVANAHAYGARKKRRFATRRVKNKLTGAIGWRIERMPNNTPDRRSILIPDGFAGDPQINPLEAPDDGTEPAAPKRKGRVARAWPFLDLEVGGVWKCTIPRDVLPVVAVVRRQNALTAERGTGPRFVVHRHKYEDALWVTRLA